MIENIRERYYRFTRSSKSVEKIEYTPRSSSKTIYLIGNGPSLNKIDTSKLIDKDTISFNRAFIAYDDWKFDPTIYMIIDPIVLENIKEEISRLIVDSEIQLFILPLWSKSYFPESPKVQYVNYNENKYIGKGFNNMGVISNVGATAIPVLKILGYDNIVILGTDCNYTESNIKGVSIEYNESDADRKIVYKSDSDNDVNHFRADYFGKGTEYSKPQGDNHYNGWKYLSKMDDFLKLNIFLCSPGSRLVDLFETKDFNDLVNKL